MKGALPNLVIIGAQKCGTTALHQYLGFHPEIVMTRTKELNFFIEQANWDRGLDWYRSRFDARRKVRGESSPNYTAYPSRTGVPERMFSVIPSAKLICLVRDPVDRITANYVHRATTGRETRPWEEVAEDLEGSIYIHRSRYYMQLERFLKLYPRQQLLVLTQKRLLENRAECMSEVFRFLEVDPSFWSKGFRRVVHRTALRRRKTGVGLALERSGFLRPLHMLPPHLRHRVEYCIYLPLSTPVVRPQVSREVRRRIIEMLSDDIGRLRDFCGPESHVGREAAAWLSG